MAAAQSSQANQSAPGTRQDLSVRIGRGAAELGRPCFPAGTSRVSRSRATKAMQGLRRRKVAVPQSPPSPNQESAINSRTGKVAFGPWLGPFETHTDASGSEPLFLDRDGNTYASLSGIDTSPVADTEKPTAVAGKGSAAAATQQLYQMVQKAVMKQAAAAQARLPKQWPNRAKPHGSGRCNSTMGRAINQPRRS